MRFQEVRDITSYFSGYEDSDCDPLYACFEYISKKKQWILKYKSNFKPIYSIRNSDIKLNELRIYEKKKEEKDGVVFENLVVFRLFTLKEFSFQSPPPPTAKKINKTKKQKKNGK